MTTETTTDQYGRETKYLGRILDIAHRHNRNAFGPGTDDHYTLLTLIDDTSITGQTVIKLPYNGMYAVDTSGAERKAAEAKRVAATRPSYLRATSGKHAGLAGDIERGMRSYYDYGMVYLVKGVWIHERDADVLSAVDLANEATEAAEAIVTAGVTPSTTPAPKARRCAGCGKILAPGEAMSASLGISCPDCYDRLSDV